MNEILAIVRLNKVSKTKKALLEEGFPAFTCRRVFGRGKEPVTYMLDDRIEQTSDLMSKRAFTLIVSEKDTEKVVDIIMNVNSTGNHGDGKIFVIPVLESYKVSTGEGHADAF